MIFAGAIDEVGEDVDGVSISWPPCMEVRPVDMLCVASLAFWVKLLPIVDTQFNWAALGSFLMLILLNWDRLFLFGLVSSTKFCFFVIILGSGWKGLLAMGWLWFDDATWTQPISFSMMDRAGSWFPKGYILLFVIYSLFWMYESPLRLTLRSISIVSSGRAHFKNPKTRSCFVDNLQYVFNYYTVSRESLVTNENQVMPCFSITWISKSSLFIIHLILSLSFSGIMTYAGRFILFPFKVLLPSFQSISMISHNIYLFNLMCSGNNFPAILNKCMLPADLYSFTGT